MIGSPNGSLAVLNTGAGDIIVTFNDHDDAETDKAIAMLVDMQRRGYAILVRQEDGTYVRATSIDRATKSYVVMPPAVAPDAADAPAEKPRRGRGRRRIAVKGATAVAVARSAGGCAQRAPTALLGRARGRASEAKQDGTAGGSGAVRRSALYPEGLT